MYFNKISDLPKNWYNPKIAQKLYQDEVENNHQWIDNIPTRQDLDKKINYLRKVFLYLEPQKSFTFTGNLTGGNAIYDIEIEFKTSALVWLSCQSELHSMDMIEEKWGTLIKFQTFTKENFYYNGLIKYSGVIINIYPPQLCKITYTQVYFHDPKILYNLQCYSPHIISYLPFYSPQKFLSYRDNYSIIISKNDFESNLTRLIMGQSELVPFKILAPFLTSGGHFGFKVKTINIQNFSEKFKLIGKKFISYRDDILYDITNYQPFCEIYWNISQSDWPLYSTQPIENNLHQILWKKMSHLKGKIVVKILRNDGADTLVNYNTDSQIHPKSNCGYKIVFVNDDFLTINICQNGDILWKNKQGDMIEKLRKNVTSYTICKKLVPKFTKMTLYHRDKNKIHFDSWFSENIFPVNIRYFAQPVTIEVFVANDKIDTVRSKLHKLGFKINLTK